MRPILRTYIAGLVVASAVALVVASFVGFQPGIGLEIDGQPGIGSLDLLAGLSFWTLLTVVTSALPVRMPSGQ